MEKTLSQEYLSALEEDNKAQNAYHLKRDAYRKKLIGDAEYLAARKAYNQAREIFDAAFMKEQNNDTK